MALRLLAVPYHLGHRGVGMGAGPDAILAAAGDAGAAERVELGEPFVHEVGACFALNRALAARLASGPPAERLPVILAGNCHSAQGTLAVAVAVGEDVGVVWFDAHADFHTPETTESGFFDGVALSLVVGDCFAELARSVPGFRPVPSDRVVLVGARDLEAGEEERLARSEVARVPAAGGAEGLGAALDELARRVASVYVHIDLDVLDPSEGRANPFAAPGGLTLPELRAALGEVAARFELRAAALTAYDPSADPDGRIARAAASLLSDLARAGD